jgi:plastocyanin
MNDVFEPDLWVRRRVLRSALGATGLAVFGGARAAEPSAVAIDNFTFSPAVLRIEAGTEVTWTNHDDIPHSIVLPKLNKRSKTIDTDGSFAYRFETPGSYDYMCGLHPHMKGKVVVG